MAEVIVAQVAQVPPGTGMVVSAGAKSVALFNVDGTFYAIDNTCTHRGGPLGEGHVQGTVVTCPWHGSQFDITSGQVVRGPARAPVATYPAHIQGSDVLIQVP
jgi:3-phenylpropionate/trans-cinnamate dioxygenase ferredoxin component